MKTALLDKKCGVVLVENRLKKESLILTVTSSIRKRQLVSFPTVTLKGKDNEKLGEIVGISKALVDLNITGKQLKALIGQLDAYSRTSRFSEAKSPVNPEPVSAEVLDGFTEGLIW